MDASNRFIDSHAYYLKSRQLFSRLVFDLGMDPTLSMEIIAFWLWLEGNGHANFIRSINSCGDEHVLAIASAGKTFVEALHLDANDVNAGSKPSSHFRQMALEGITHYLHDFCQKAFDDLEAKDITEAKNHIIKALVHQMGQAYQDHIREQTVASAVRLDRSPVDKQSVNHCREDMDDMFELSSHNNLRSNMLKSSAQSYTLYGEGSSSNRSNGYENNQRLQDIIEGQNETQSIHPFATFLGGMGFPQLLHHRVGMSSRSNVPNLEAPLDQHVDPFEYPTTEADYYLHSTTPLHSLPRSRFDVPHDERTLFVTFSNGYPLTKEELYDFFMRNFGDVEEILIEEPVDPRPPLYAHVTFYSLETLLGVLAGNKRVKFMTRGKHLWARQFIPKRKNKAAS